MRGFGLLFLLLGLACLGTAYVHAEVPLLEGLSNTNLWIIGGCFVALGTAAVALSREGD